MTIIEIEKEQTKKRGSGRQEKRKKENIINEEHTSSISIITM
jgi:hypothetical protein